LWISKTGHKLHEVTCTWDLFCHSWQSASVHSIRALCFPKAIPEWDWYIWAVVLPIKHTYLQGSDWMWFFGLLCVVFKLRKNESHVLCQWWPQQAHQSWSGIIMG
jgi:hypothetical protein